MKKNLSIRTRGFYYQYMGDITTCFGATGPPSGNTYILNYLEDKMGYGCFVYK